VLAVIYSAFSIGVAIKLLRYDISSLRIAPFIPFLLLVVFPVFYILRERKENRSIGNTLLNIIVVPYVSLKLFPLHVGLVAQMLIKSKKTVKKGVVKFNLSNCKNYFEQFSYSFGMKRRLLRY